MTPTDHEAVKRFLRDTPLLGGLDERALDRIVGMLVEHAFPTGATVYEEADPGNEMYLIRSGAIDIVKNARGGERVTIARAGQGEVFGDMTLMDIQPRSASVVARDPLTVYALSNKDLYALYREDVRTYALIVQNLCREQCRRLRRSDRRLCEFLARSGGVEPESTGP